MRFFSRKKNGPSERTLASGNPAKRSWQLYLLLKGTRERNTRGSHSVLRKSQCTRGSNREREEVTARGGWFWPYSKPTFASPQEVVSFGPIQNQLLHARKHTKEVFFLRAYIQKREFFCMGESLEDTMSTLDNFIVLM